MRGYNVLFPMAFHYTGTPILAIAKRIAVGDVELIEELLKTYKVPAEKIKEFTDPLSIATYFRDEIKASMEALGYSIDWRREFTTIDPQYNRFVEWQFNRLREKNLITKGSHPVGWCPNCGNPLGQHDTKGDVEPEIGELLIIKFRLGGAAIPTGTLRPETVFGVTNLWVRPNATYVEAEVDGERWIVSEECSAKLKLLDRRVRLLARFSGSELLGRWVENPVTGSMIPILPASFVDPKNATGVVMSVPAHAPYDWVALEELKNNPSIAENYGLDQSILAKVVPVSLISLDGYSEFPALDVLRQTRAAGQGSELVDAATREVYSKEFHMGVMKENTGKYAGLKVSEARSLIEFELIKAGKGEPLFEIINRPVYCRCGAEAAVKILRDQWFIDYGNKEWKAMAKECLDGMKIIPEELRGEFMNVIEWLREKACARRQGMGTKLPWDRDWIIESLSDSVIYMAYYTLAKHINSKKIGAENLNDAVFDYLLLGQGSPEDVARSSGIDVEALKEMRSELTYFYPLDSRNSGRDLVPNHLTFFIFNHAALFPRNLWPKQIVVTGSVLMEGKKMSKSLGNIIPLSDAIKEYGADPFRLTILSTAELLQDADFSPSLAKAQAERLERLYALAVELAKAEEDEGANTALDCWMLSRLQLCVKAVTEAMEDLRLREAIHNTLYLLEQDLQWYLRRKSAEKHCSDSGTARVLREVLKTRILLLAPFTPHLSEELWEMLGGKVFASLAEWPEYDHSKVDQKTLLEEDIVKSLYEDIQSILQATKITPKRIFFYTAAKWKWTTYLLALRLFKEGKLNPAALIRTLMKDPELRKYGDEVAHFAGRVASELPRTSRDVLENRLAVGEIDEHNLLSMAKSFFSKEFRSGIEVYSEEDLERYDPKGRARLAEPYRPGIYVE
jgi:leucyl-tRNA synthetase